MEGYVLMSQKENNCGVATNADYAIVKWPYWLSVVITCLTIILSSSLL